MEKISEKILFEGNWLHLKEITCYNSDGDEIKWESVERICKKTILIIIAKLVPSDRHVLIRQYRPTINTYIIGFPAGVSDSSDTSAEALRELKEETGYTGKVTSISPPLKINPGIMDESIRVINVEIDETSSQNKNPEQSLEPEEEIEVILKREQEVMEFLNREREKGHEISVGVWYVFGLKRK